MVFCTFGSIKIFLNAAFLEAVWNGLSLPRSYWLMLNNTKDSIIIPPPLHIHRLSPEVRGATSCVFDESEVFHGFILSSSLWYFNIFMATCLTLFSFFHLSLSSFSCPPSSFFLLAVNYSMLSLWFAEEENSVTIAYWTNYKILVNSQNTYFILFNDIILNWSKIKTFISA